MKCVPFLMRTAANPAKNPIAILSANTNCLCDMYFNRQIRNLVSRVRFCPGITSEYQNTRQQEGFKVAVLY
ncbi:MAG: hypothetical protein ACI86C_000198 [Candidatus Latescibacterota bacterium]|jgi:hypothetical protein